MGIIGCGHWGPNHLRVFNSLPESRVTVAADKESARLSRLRQMAPELLCFEDYRSLLASDCVEAVVVATPTATHFEIVKQALLAGKHVLCEKPLCLLASEAEELVRLSQRGQRVLMVGHVFLFNAGIVKLKELLGAGELGKPLHLSAVRTNLGPVRSDVNAAFDLASHDIAIFNWLLDAVPEHVQAMGAAFLQPGIEDVVTITLKYPGNIVGTIQVSWLHPKKIRQITLVGAKKMATWDDLDLGSPVAVYEKGVSVSQDITDYGEFLRLSMYEGDVHLPRVVPVEPLKTQAQCFLRGIREGKLSHSDGSFAAGVVRVLERIAVALGNV